MARFNVLKYFSYCTFSAFHEPTKSVSRLRSVSRLWFFWIAYSRRVNSSCGRQ
jgi:hypothetical protein